MTSVNHLVEQFISAGGASRRFERGVSATFEYYESYLRRFGFRLRMKSWRCEISQDGGRWQSIARVKVVALVNDLRAAEGLEPIRGRT